jgi:phytol kinase
MMPLTWGDAAAAILGKRFGVHKFTLFSQTSSWEGSLAMFVFSLLGTLFALLLFGQPVGTSFFLSLATAFFASIAEALSQRGIDNLTVPIVSAIVLVGVTSLAK